MLEGMSHQVRDNAAESRYEIVVEGAVAGFSEYRLHDGRITLVHTEVDPAYEGLGLGSELARAALDDIRSRGLELVPLCPFVAAFIRRHQDEYLDLVAPEMRERITAGG